MKRVTTILFLMLLICVHTAAQQKVKLEVLEKGTEQPIIAANVIYADNEALRNPQYAITNTSGQAELKLPSKGICYYKVTYIGYVPVTGKIGGTQDEKVIYIMSSGATHEVAYSSSVCLMMEMQWINSGTFHAGEFFHGPFEIVDKDVPFILLMNDGKTRAIDSRALAFLDRFDAKTEVVDALDYGLSAFIEKEVLDYFNPFVITAVFRVYAEELSYAREHPLTKRRYMWKLSY